MKNLKRQNGYTLVEILVASTIFVSVVGMGMATYTSASGFQSKSAVIRETNQAARYAMDRIVSDIRGADGNVDYPGLTSSVPNIITKTYKTLNAFSFMLDGNNYFLSANATPIIITPLAIYSKGESSCALYVKQVVYYIGDKPSVPGAKTILKVVRYVNPLTYAEAISPCAPVVAVDLLSNRVQLAGNTVESFSISGNDARVPCTTITKTIPPSSNTTCVQPVVSPKVTIQMKIVPVGADPTKAEESRTIVLKTTVVPRNVQ